MREAQLDWRVLVFALGLSLIAAILFGLAPALERLRGEALAAARAVGRRRNRLRPALVSAQVAISVVLLTASGMLLLSLWRLQQTRLGFAPQRVVTASFILPEQRYGSQERQIAFYNDLEQRLQDLPGVVSAAITDSLPPSGDPRSRPFVALVGGGDSAGQGLAGLVYWRFVSPGYFQTLGIPVIRGRAFTEEDRRAGTQAIVLSEALARRLFGEQDAVGKQLRLEVPALVVGVAADVRNNGLEAHEDPEFYVLRGAVPNALSGNQRPPFGWRRATAVVRSSAGSRFAADSLRDTIQKIDPTVAVVAGSLEGQVGLHFARPRFQTALLSLFAAIGLLLAAIGLYGLTSFLVVERTREVGVRMAMGATPNSIVRMMMSEGLRWTSIGIVAGSLAALGVFHWLRSLLFAVEAIDAGVFGGAVALLVFAAALAAWLPSLRAAKIDPMQALRHD